MKKELTRFSLTAFCMSDFARAIYNGLVVTYLMTIYVPTDTSTLPILLPRAAVTFAIIRAIGAVVDAVIDLGIASKSDRLTSKNGRRIPFMRAAFIPWAVSCALLAFTPVQTASPINTVWFAVMITVYFISSSFYLVPYSALSTEIVTKPDKRVWFYTMQTLFFVLGSAVVYVTPFIKKGLMGAGLSELTAWRVVFALFGTIGLITSGIPAFLIKEKDYVEAKPSYVPLLPAFKATFKYKHYTLFTVGYLFMQVAFSFFNAALMYYITMLIGAPETFATIVMVVAMVVGVASYPLVNFFAKKYGKKPLLIFACAAYIVIYAAIYLYNFIVPAIGSTAFSIIIGLTIGFPISITNIIPSAIYADMAQYDSIITKDNKQAMFVAAKSFVLQFSQSAVLMIIPLVISLKSTDSRATVFGVRTTAAIALVMIAVALVLYRFYNDTKIQKAIAEDIAQQAAS